MSLPFRDWPKCEIKMIYHGLWCIDTELQLWCHLLNHKLDRSQKAIYSENRNSERRAPWGTLLVEYRFWYVLNSDDQTKPINKCQIWTLLCIHVLKDPLLELVLWLLILPKHHKHICRQTICLYSFRSKRYDMKYT